MVTYTDSNGVVRQLNVEDCEHGCAKGDKCGTGWECRGGKIATISFFSVVIAIGGFFWIRRCLKERREEAHDNSYQRQ